MPRVDFVVPGDPATLTGGYVYDRRIAESLEGLGWRTCTRSLNERFPLPDRAAFDDARRMLASIPDGRAVVIDGLALAGLAPLLDGAARRLRLIALVHHPLADETGLDEPTRSALLQAEHDALAQVEAVIVTSRWTAARLDELGMTAAPVTVVEPGTDRVGPSGTVADADRPASDTESDSDSDSDSETVRLLCVATLTPRKGHALLLEALSMLEDLPWRLDCVGSAERDRATAAALCDAITRLGLDGRVLLHGEVGAAALARLYRDADVFVLASFLEGYGMALADALVHGLPVVATAGGAIPETVPAGSGLLVPPGDSDALSRAIAALVRDKALRMRLAAGARAAGLALPTWADAGRRFAAAIETALARRGAAVR